MSSDFVVVIGIVLFALLIKGIWDHTIGKLEHGSKAASTIFAIIFALVLSVIYFLAK